MYSLSQYCKSGHIDAVNLWITDFYNRLDGLGSIPAGADGIRIISKDKNLRPGDHLVPEPSSFVMAGFGLVAAAVAYRRRRAA